jgi:hypothetical protein
MSFKIHRNIFTPEICAELIDMVPALSENVVTFAGVETARRRIGISEPVLCYLHQLSEIESQSYCDIIRMCIPNIKIVAFRIIQYPIGSSIRDHYDGPRSIDGDSNSSLIVQLSDPRSYKGGYLNIEREFIDLGVGDGVQYGYQTMHGVSTIKESERWVLNVRLYEEKSNARI